MSRITDSESDEIQRNLERFMDEQILEYRYTQMKEEASRTPEVSFQEMELDVPNIGAPKNRAASTGISYIDISRDSYANRSYEDDLDDDVDEGYEPSEEDYEYDDEEFERRKAERAARRNRKNKRKDRREPEGEFLEDGEMPPKKKKKKPLKILLIIVIILALLAAGAFAAWRWLIGAAYDKMTYKEAPKFTNTALTEEGVTNILLLGNDSREKGDDGRTDSIILMTINRKQNKIYLTSFLRDIKVNIPGKGVNRLNHAYAYGGPELIMQTIAEAFDIKISRYMLVNFQAFANLADAVGGVDLEITAKETDWINAYLWEYNDINGDDIYKDNLPEGTEGMVHLNGPQALAYCRNRKIGTDFERTNRQKKVITAIIKKAPKAALTNLGGLMDGLFPSLTTSLTKDDTYELANLVFGLKGMEIVQGTIPQDDTWKSDQSTGMDLIAITDMEKNKEYLKQIMLSK
ncbi:MAG: LytR family transcriptional regulator [Lachnospiraceae bacterium]|nr:LytR family transcriptional regulator [Lachnospiraceae bacterium]